MRFKIIILLFVACIMRAEAAWNGCTISQKLDVAIIYDASESMANGDNLKKLKDYMSEVVKIFNIQTRDPTRGVRLAVWGYTYTPHIQFDFESCVTVEHALTAISRIRPMGKTGVHVAKMFEFAANNVFTSNLGSRVTDPTVKKVAILIVDSELVPHTVTPATIKAQLQSKKIETYAIAIEDGGIKAAALTPYMPTPHSTPLKVATKMALATFTGVRENLKLRHGCSKCFPNPCKNSAPCKEKATSPFYKCECIAGWVGTNCLTQDPCQLCRSNRGTCIPSGSKIVCKDCPPDKIGEYCHLPNPCHPAPGPCKNRATCKSNVQTLNAYDCVCVGEFTGKNCDKTKTPKDICVGHQCSGYKCVAVQGKPTCACPANCKAKPDCSVCTPVTPCTPNPCLNGCQCKLSARHESGFLCSGSKANLGRLCDIAPADILCGPTVIEVKIPESVVKAYESGVKGAIVYFSPTAGNTHSCVAVYDSGSKKYVLKIPAPFSTCGTKKNAITGGFEYTNNVWMNRKSNVIDMPVPVLQFKCTYGGSQTVISTSIQPALPPANAMPVITNSGKFKVIMNAYTKAPGAADRQKLTGGSVYTVGQIVYLTAELEISNKPTSGNLVLKIIDCYATPSLNSLTGKLDLVKQGCPEKSVGVKIHGTTLTSSATVWFRTFKLSKGQYVYYTCKVDVCNTLEATCKLPTNCATTGRRKRDVESGNPDEKKNLVSVGPLIILTKNEKEKLSESLADPDQPVYISGELISLGGKDLTTTGSPLPDTASHDLQLVLVSLANFVVLVLFSICALCLVLARKKRNLPA
ncbi:uncharacterized protein LOC120348385 [Styela clava]